jgi:hypothetical protein
MNKETLECNNHWVHLKNGRSIAVDLNMFYEDEGGDMKEIHDAINSGQAAMVFYQARPNVISADAEDVMQPILINLAEIAAIVPISSEEIA